MADNFIQEIIEKTCKQKNTEKRCTRAFRRAERIFAYRTCKSICLNFSTAAKYGGKCN